MSRVPENLPKKNAGKNLPKKNAPQKNGAPAGPVFDIRENRLCVQLETNKDKVRARRNYFLTRGQHWDYVRKRVLYSAIGAQILRETRDAVLPAREDARPTGDDTARGKKPVALLCERNPRPIEFKGRLIAWKAPERNRRILICYLPGADPLNLVTLRVRDNGNFMRGMRIPDDKPPGNKVKITPVKEREDVFDLQGPIPRWRGRW